MSFIYDDKNLLNKLLKAGQTQPQVTPAAKTDPAVRTRAVETARQLLSNLEQQVSGKDVFTAGRDDAAARTTHLKDLESLLQFLNFNKIAHNAKEIVIPNRPQLMQPSYYEGLIKSGYTPYSSDGKEPYQFYIDKAALMAYLKSLQGSANAIQNAMVNSLIEKANAAMQLNLVKDTLSQPLTPTKPHVDVAGSTTVELADPKVAPNKVVDNSQLFAQIGTTLPFDTHDIDFNRINAFFKLYTQLIGYNQTNKNVRGDSKTQVFAAIQQAEAAMAKASSNTPINRRNFPLDNLNAAKVAGWLKNPQGQYFDSTIQALLTVIQNTEVVVEDLYNSYSRRASTDAADKMSTELHNLVQQQIIGNSIYNHNFNTLKEVENRLGEITQRR